VCKIMEWDRSALAASKDSGWGELVEFEVGRCELPKNPRNNPYSTVGIHDRLEPARGAESVMGVANDHS